MSPSLTAEFEYLTSRIDAMVEKVRELPTDAQEAPVGPSYSPRKALEHMALTEMTYTGYAAKTNAEKLKGRKGRPNFLYRIILKAISKPAGQAAPTGGPFVPKGQMSIDQAAAKWKEERAKLMAHLQKFEDDDACLKNPIMGYLSPRDLFVLMERHQDYHEARIPN